MPSSVAEEHVPSQIELAWTPAGIKLLSLFGLDRIRGDPSVHSPSILPQILIAKLALYARRQQNIARVRNLDEGGGAEYPLHSLPTAVTPGKL